VFFKICFINVWQRPYSVWSTCRLRGRKSRDVGYNGDHLLTSLDVKSATHRTVAWESLRTLRSCGVFSQTCTEDFWRTRLVANTSNTYTEVVMWQFRIKTIDVDILVLNFRLSIIDVARGCTGRTCTPRAKEKIGGQMKVVSAPQAERAPSGTIEQESHFKKNWGDVDGGSGQFSGLFGGRKVQTRKLSCRSAYWDYSKWKKAQQLAFDDNLFYQVYVLWTICSTVWTNTLQCIYSTFFGSDAGEDTK